mgnify:CR=1 FL=1
MCSRAGLRTGHIRDAQPKEAVQTAASYRSGDEAIVIQQYPNGQFYNHYGYDEQRRFAIATAGGFATFEEIDIEHIPIRDARQDDLLCTVLGIDGERVPNAIFQGRQLCLLRP